METTTSNNKSFASEVLSKFSIKAVRSDEDLQATIELFHEYTKWLDLDLSFQDFGVEMASMPGKYAPPKGELLLARSIEGEAIGCVAVRPLDETICEMKRLWVRDSAKGLGVGKALVAAVIETGQQLGYRSMRLDTLPRMTAAVQMYRALGFVDIDPYYVTPLTDTHFLELDLTKKANV